MQKKVFAAAVLTALVLALPASSPAASSVVVTADPGTTIEGPVRVHFSQAVQFVDPSNVVVRVQGSTQDLPSSVSCIDSSGAETSCAVGDVFTAQVDPTDVLVTGQRYTVTVNPDGASPVSDKLLQPVSQATLNVASSTFGEEWSLGAGYSWATLTSSKALGGSYKADRLAGSSFTLTFTGTSVTWYTRTGPAQGLASVSIDGSSRGTVNLYSSLDHWHIRKTFSGLSSGQHRLRVGVQGKAGSPNGTGSWVSADAFVVNGTLSSSPALTFAWQPIHTSSAYGGRYVRTVVPHSRVSFLFRGHTIDWVTVTGPSQGRAAMYIDGTRMRVVDNRSSTTRYHVTRRISDLTDAVHRLTIVASSGYVSVDRFVVRPTDVSSFRRLGAWVDLFDYGLDPATTISAMRSRGVHTLYIETARYNSSSSFDYLAKIGQWVDAAHAAGIRIIGWYLPTYGTYLSTDVSRTVAIARYVSPAGNRFDGLAVDIEQKTSAQTRAAWFSDIGTHLRRVRSSVGSSYPVGAIIPAPVAMDMNPSRWSGFPWTSIGTYANVVLPMGYWSYRTDCSSDPTHCAYGYSAGNIKEARQKTGLLVHLIGGVGNDVTASEVSDFIRASRDNKAYGASLYDYRTTAPSFWGSLAKANNL